MNAVFYSFSDYKPHNIYQTWLSNVFRMQWFVIVFRLKIITRYCWTIPFTLVACQTYQVPSVIQGYKKMSKKQKYDFTRTKLIRSKFVKIVNILLHTIIMSCIQLSVLHSLIISILQPIRLYNIIWQKLFGGFSFGLYWMGLGQNFFLQYNNSIFLSNLKWQYIASQSTYMTWLS